MKGDAKVTERILAWLLTRALPVLAVGIVCAALVYLVLVAMEAAGVVR